MIQIADPEVTEEVLQSLSDEEKEELIKKYPELAPIFTDWKVGRSLNLSECTLTSLPEGLKVGWDLWLSGCTSLPCLPEGLEVGGNLHLGGCTGLTCLPEGLKVSGNLHLGGCTGLTCLPEGLKVGGYLCLEGCTSLTSLPEGLKVDGNLDLFGCTSLPYKKKSDLPCKKGIKGRVYWE